MFDSHSFAEFLQKKVFMLETNHLWIRVTETGSLLSFTFLLFCRVEQRLMKEDGELWFGEDGHMNNEADPVKRYYERAPQFFDPDAFYLQTFFVEPSLTQTAIHLIPE